MASYPALRRDTLADIAIELGVHLGIGDDARSRNAGRGHHPADRRAQIQIVVCAHARFRLVGGELVVGVPNLHFQDWLNKKFGADVQAAAKQVAGRAIPVRFVIEPALFQAARSEQAAAAAESLEPAKSRPKKVGKPTSLPPDATPSHAIRRSRPRDLFETPRPKSATPRSKTSRRWHHLADFVVGPCNRVAHASALSVVESPGQGDNPVVIHGPVGTGKSHLLEGVYAGLARPARIGG